LLSEAQLSEQELRVPLDFAFCPSCSLAQITQTVDPNVLFCRDYPYFSSVSPTLMEHFNSSARRLIDSRRLGPNSMVVEAASNDGYMLQTFVDSGIPALGIDPAEGPVAAAVKRGVPTMRAFFDAELARTLREGFGIRAEVFLANNVLAHVPDLNGFVAGIKALLKSDGVAVIEVPYLIDLVDHCEFDTIYHQHLCYFSVTALDALFTRHGMYLNDVERTSIHGGSLRLSIELRDDRRERVALLLAMERERGINDVAFYRNFAARVESIKDRLSTLLHQLRADGRRVAAYGAAAKATTLCSYVGIDRTLVEYVADRNEHKEGRYMAGNRLPIVSPDRMRRDQPDYLLILAWNFAEEIMRQEHEFRERGGRFIVPIPNVEVVS
jgi:SAM-dependent methyltransferase